jgi:hypothetical protein
MWPLKKQDNNKLAIIENLRATITPGETIYGILRHVSRSGMMRVVSVFLMKDGQPYNISGFVAQAIGFGMNSYGDIKVGGCGMDVLFEIQYNLSVVLFGDGYKLEYKWL